MNNNLFLAQAAGDSNSSGITSVPVNPEGQATTLAPDSNAGGPQMPPPAKPFGYGQFILLALMLVVMYFILFRGPRKQQQQKKQMVQSLQKNDKVQTIGGIIGTVVDVKDDEITLKIDESNNTKIKIVASAVGRNLSKEKA